MTDEKLIPDYEVHMKYDVWMEGFAATGERADAEFLGSYEADSFDDACAKAAAAKGWETAPGSFQPRRVGARVIRDSQMVHDPAHVTPPSFWGRRMFDNEADARRSFG